MKSIKPGRGPSAMGAMGSVFAAIFGVIWTIAAASMGAPWFFCLFGVFFVIMAVVTGLYNYKNATGKNRYSEFDIVEDYEESDPFNDRFGYGHREDNEYDRGYDSFEDSGSRESNFCPYCGEKVNQDYEFCPKCGKRLP